MKLFTHSSNGNHCVTGRLFFLLFVLLNISIKEAKAQSAAQYSFTAFSSPFNQIYGSSGITNVSSIQTDDASSGLVPIGFSFVFCGVAYTQVAVNSNGFMTFGFVAASGCCSSNITTSGFQPGVFPLSIDLHGGYPLASPASSANYITTGSPGSRVFTFEWYGWSAYSSSTTGQIANEMSFQVILYEGSNKIQFAYRRDAAFATYANTSGPGIGIAKTTADFQALPNASASPTPSTSTSVTIATSTFPATNQVYEWDPPLCNATPSAATAAPATTVLCAGGSVTFTATTALNGVGGISYQWQTASAATGPWTNIPGATSLSYTTPVLLASAYYRITDTCNNTIPHTGAASNVCTVSVSGTAIPYIQNFDFPSNVGLSNYGIPACMQRNVNGGNVNLINESFENSFPPTGWNTTNTVSTAWSTSTGVGSANPVFSPHTGSKVAFYNSFSIGSGYSELETPALNMSAPGTYTVSLWVYRDPSGNPYTSTTFSTEGISTYATTTTSAAGTLLGYVPRSYNFAPAAPAAGGWIQYTYTVPVALQTAATYIIFRAFSDDGDNQEMDDVTVTYNAPVSEWGQLGPNMYHAADGTILPWCVYASDTSGNTNGKLDYITTPALPLVQGVTYRAWFGYARGASNWTNNTGTAPNNENLYLLVGQTNPGANSITNPIAGFPGTLIFSTLPAGITSNAPVPTTANNVTYTAPSTGAYFFSWVDNTPHGGLTTTANGTVALDSIKIDSVGCSLATILSQPAATTTVCAGFPVTFSVAGAGYGISYQWYKNGSIINGATATSYTIASASATDAANYTVSVSGTCGGANSVLSNIAALVVNTSPTAIVTPAASTIICPGTTVQLNANTGIGYSYQWYNGTGPIAGATSASYTAGLADNYHVVVTSSNSCYTASSNTPVTVLSAPPAVALPAGNTTICAGTCVTINANTGSYAYQWYNNGSSLPGATSASYLACSTGVYTVKVTNTSNGCFAVSSLSVPVTVNPLPSAVVSASGADTFCQNGSVTLIIPFSGSVSYQWYNGSSPLIGQNTNTYIATQTGAYTLKVTNPLTGCSSLSNVNNVLLNIPPATVSSPNTSLCAGNIVTLSANTGSNLSYQWYQNGYAINGATAATYSTSVSGNYTVMVTSVAGSYSCSNVSSPPVVLQSYSPPPAYITTANATTFCAGNSIVLNADTGTGYIYQWMLNGVNIFQGTTANLLVVSSGNYTVKVTNAQGCFGSSPATTVTVIPLPTPLATASGNTQLCPGGNVSLSTSTAPGLTYQWYNGTTAIPGATFPIYVTASTANYSVVVTNNTGCQGTSNTLPVVMNTIPSSVITAGGPTSICSGASVSLSAPSVSGYNYQWAYNGTAITGANSTTYQASTAGSYTVTVTNVAAGCSSSTATATNLVVFPLPGATSSSIGPTSVCDGSSVILVANSGSGLTYQWNNSGTPMSSATHITDTVAVSGSYTVTVTDNNGCMATSLPSLVSVFSIPAAGFVPGGDTGFCQGNSVTLLATSGNNYSYQWKKNGVNIAGANGQSYQANQVGAYSVVVTNNICSAESSIKNVTIYPQPSNTASLLGADTICFNDSVQIQAVIANGYLYQWSDNGSPIAGATHSSVWARAAGTYTAAVTSNYGCTATTQSINIYNFPPPNPGIIANGLILSTGTFVSYQWYRGGTAASDMILGAVGNSYAANQSGDYYAFVTDAHGCSQFSPVHTVGTTGVVQMGNGNTDIKIYPNPATSVVYIESAVKVKVRISGIEGKLLIEENAVNHVDISKLANGVYMISIYDEQGGLLKVDRLLKNGQ